MHIFNAVLQERKIPNPEDILDHGGFQLVHITSQSKSLITFSKQLNFYLILPEVITEFYMAKKTMSYKEASFFLYGGSSSATPSPYELPDWSTV